MKCLLYALTPHSTSSGLKRRRIGKTSPDMDASRRANDSRGAVPAPLCDLPNIAATVPMVSCPRDPRSLSISSCTEPYDSSMWTSVRAYNDVQKTLPGDKRPGRAYDVSMAKQNTSAGVLRQSYTAKKKGDYAHRFYIERKPLNFWPRGKVCLWSVERGHRLSSRRLPYLLSHCISQNLTGREYRNPQGILSDQMLDRFVHRTHNQF
jgi:hypothetical protein